MITYVRGTSPSEYRGLSTDNKSTIEIPGNGAIFFEWDTGNIYFYNIESGTWDLYEP